MRPRWMVLGAAVALSACSEHTDAAGPGGNGPGVEVELTNFAFSPAEVTVEPGTRIRWVNGTASFHTVTPDGHEAWTEWQTGGTGESVEVVLNAPGTYEYYCAPHRSLGMTGRIVVQ